MKPLHRQILSFLLPVAVLLGCEDKTTGTMDETNHAASAIVYAADGKPVPQALVQAFRRDDTSRVAAATVITGADGSYALPTLENGLYRVIARKGPLVGVQDSVYAAAGKSTAGSDTLEGAPVATGVVTMTGDDNPASVLVQVQGTDVLVNVDADGNFSLNSLAAGTYTLRLATELEGYTVTTKTIRILRGQATVLDTVAMNYSAVPPVNGLAASIDSATGKVRLSWSLPALKGVRDVQISRVEKSSSIAPDVLGVSDSGRFTDALGQAPVATTWLYTAQIRMLDGRIGRTAYVTVVQPAITSYLPQIRIGLGNAMADGDSSWVNYSASGDSVRLVVIAKRAAAKLAGLTLRSSVLGLDTAIGLNGDSVRFELGIRLPRAEMFQITGTVRDSLGRSDSLVIHVWNTADSADTGFTAPAQPEDSVKLGDSVTADDGVLAGSGSDTLKWIPGVVASGVSGQHSLSSLSATLDTSSWALRVQAVGGCGEYRAVLDTAVWPIRVNLFANSSVCSGGTVELVLPLAFLQRRSFVLYNAGTIVRQF